MDRLTLAEAAPTLAGMRPTGKGRYRALLIREGWGSSGYYSRQVLERDGPRCWPAGTQQYLDHPTLTERQERPEGSVKDLASVLVTDPVWDETERGLVAEVEVFPQWRDLLNEEFTRQIGLSIRAFGTAEHGEAEGREGPIVTSLSEGISVDWVTRAGAGGKVLQLIESARQAGEQVSEAVSDKPWSGFSQADYSIEQWRKACLIGPESPSQDKSDYSLPVREPSGAVNRNAVHAAASRLNQTSAPAAKKAAAARKLVALYKQLGEDPPAALAKAAGKTGGKPDDDTGKPPASKTPAKESAWELHWVGEHGPEAAELAEAGSSLGASLESRIHTAFTLMADQAYGEGRLTRPERIGLSSAFGDALKTYVDRVEAELPQLYKRGRWSYPDEDTDTQVTESAPTTNVPAGSPTPEPGRGPTDPASGPHNAPGSTPADDKKEGAMPEITEEQARQLAEAATVKAELDAARAKLAEAEKRAEAAKDLTEATKTLTDRITQLETRLSEADARNQRLETERIASAKVADVLRESGLPARAQARVTAAVCANLPTGEDGRLDAAALAESTKNAIADERAYIASVTEDAGAGTVRGLGSSTKPASGFDESALDAQLERAFMEMGLTESDAKAAAFIR